jgi:hypothetical protein
LKAPRSARSSREHEHLVGAAAAATGRHEQPAERVVRPTVVEAQVRREVVIGYHLSASGEHGGFRAEPAP